MWLASPFNNDKDEGQQPKSGEESSGAPSRQQPPQDEILERS
jgi:hypothetical protein